MKVRVGVLIAAVMMTYACSSDDPPSPDVSLPAPEAGVITFYLSLPSSAAELTRAATAVATPGSGQYRRFVPVADAGRKYGASDEQITGVADSITKLGMRFAADPSRLFGRVSGTATQWQSALGGTSAFVAAGDSGSTTCGPGPGRTTLSYPAVSPFVTAVGGTRLALGSGNVRSAETVWNDSVYGEDGAGGGAVARKEARPWYQNGVHEFSKRAVPDVSALADIVPGWPVVMNGGLQPVGGTSGSTPLTAAAAALVAANERNAGRPPIGLANGWFYQAATQPSTFFDVTKGNNDLDRVGCCTAKTGYDTASGLGVPNWATLPGALPQPG